MHTDKLLLVDLFSHFTFDQAFDIDVWYPILQEFTFKSEFHPFTRQEAVAILNYQNTVFLSRDRLGVGDIEVLRQLEEKLDSALKLRFPTGAFMRLCGRSPKDGEPLDRSSVYARYKSALKSLVEDEHAPLTANTKLRAIARINWMCVRTGADALSLLLTSERVFADLHDWLLWGKPEQVR